MSAPDGRPGPTPPDPPRLARFLASLAVPDPHSEFVIGDLDEQFARAVTTRGRAAARRAYWRQALCAAWHTAPLRSSRANVRAPRNERRLDMSNLWRDLRLGLRTALGSPGYSAIAIFTLALAIGANTLLFSIANPLIIRGVPLRDPGTLGWIFENNQPSGVIRGGASMADFLEWRSSATSFTHLAAREFRGATLTGHGDAERIQIARVTADLCDIWGLHPAVGRLFRPGEDAPGSAAVGVLSFHYWKGPFAGDPAVLGRVVSIDGTPTTIVGVMESEIEVYGYATTDVWVPLPLDPAIARDQRGLRVVGRLAPSATVASAGAEVGALSAAQARAHPETNANWQATVVSTHTAITGPDTWVLLGLLGVVVLFVLLIACANLANLVLARVLRRRLDFAVRLALGASRLQLVRPLLAESLLLGLAGGVGGLAVAYAGLRAINATAHDTLLQQIGIDINVLMFAGALSLVTPVLFSLWPALGAGRAATAETLRDARSSGGRPARRRRHVLVGAEVALALSLLVVSGLVLRTMMNFQHVDIGLDIAHVLTFRVEPPADRYPDDPARAKFVRDLVTRLGTMPGATGAAVVSHLPVFDAETIRTMTGTHHDGTRDDDRPFASWFAATPDFFRVAGIRLLAGRALEASDLAGTQPVAVFGRLAAEKYFDRIEDAIGRTVLLKGRGAVDRPVTIVGVVTDTKDSQVTRTSPQIYVAFDQWPVEALTVLVRSAAPADRIQDVRAAVKQVDPNVAVAEPRTLAALVEDNTADNAIVNGLFAGFAGLALVLAAAGLYGVISQSVGQRQREIGVRIALGAAPASIRWMVVAESLRVTGAGMIAGLLLAAALSHAASSVLYGVSASDPLTFGAVVVIVLVVSVAAVWGPASRAMRVDPARTLRAD
jgi:putative ABC transport system permease protein